MKKYIAKLLVLVMLFQVFCVTPITAETDNAVTVNDSGTLEIDNSEDFDIRIVSFIDGVYTVGIFMKREVSVFDVGVVLPANAEIAKTEDGVNIARFEKAFRSEAIDYGYVGVVNPVAKWDDGSLYTVFTGAFTTPFKYSDGPMAIIKYKLNNSDEKLDLQFIENTANSNDISDCDERDNLELNTEPEKNVFDYTVADDGTIEILKYTGDAEEIVIPSVIDGVEVGSINEVALDENDTVTKIEFEGKVPDNLGEKLESLAVLNGTKDNVDLSEQVPSQEYTLKVLGFENDTYTIGIVANKTISEFDIGIVTPRNADIAIDDEGKAGISLNSDFLNAGLDSDLTKVINPEALWEDKGSYSVITGCLLNPLEFKGVIAEFKYKLKDANKKLDLYLIENTANSVSAKDCVLREHLVVNENPNSHVFDYIVKEDGSIEITKYTGEEEVLVIPAYIDNFSVSSIDAKAFDENNTVKSISFEGKEPENPEGKIKLLMGLILKGDLDNDSNITSSDALTVLKCAAQLGTYTKDQLYCGDVNNDGIVDAKDALVILKYSAKLINSFDN